MQIYFFLFNLYIQINYATTKNIIIKIYIYKISQNLTIEQKASNVNNINSILHKLDTNMLEIQE